LPQHDRIVVSGSCNRRLPGTLSNRISVERESIMRNLILAVSATAMAIPVSMALPTESAQAQRYYRNGNYVGPTWRDSQGRYRCRRSNGTTGLIVGGAAGALIGRSVDGGRNRTTGTIVGAVAGALVGREIQRNSRSGRRCR
jgi:hypothetical protein